MSDFISPYNQGFSDNHTQTFGFCQVVSTQFAACLNYETIAISKLQLQLF